MNDQRSPEWFKERCGKITASRIDAVMAKPKGKNTYSATRANYKAQLVLERITGEEKGSNFQTKAMERGTELEPEARWAYNSKFDVVAEPQGFIQHPTIPNAGCSPDGFVGDEGMIQIKCPYPANHIEWLTSGAVPTEHRKQMAMELSCCPERKWSDFVSYCPDMPPHLQLFVARLKREDARDIIEEIDREVMKLDAEIEETIRHLPKNEPILETLGKSVAQAREARGLPPEEELLANDGDLEAINSAQQKLETARRQIKRTPGMTSVGTLAGQVMPK